MQCLLRIGYEKFLLPTDKGVQTILNALSKARRVSISGDKRREEGRIELEPGLIECSLEMLPGYECRTRPAGPRADVVDAEVLKPRMLEPPRARQLRAPVHRERLSLPEARP